MASTAASTASLLSVTPSETYARSGIGGAGNYRRSSIASSLSPYSQADSASRRSSFCSGIGGAGNFYNASSSSSFVSTVHHVKGSPRQSFYTGRGGAGNYVKAKKSAAQPTTETAVAQRLVQRLRDTLSR